MIPPFRDKAIIGNTTKLFGKPIKTNKAEKPQVSLLGYQTVRETLQWLKKKDFRYGNNPPYDFASNNANEIGNPQPSL